MWSNRSKTPPSLRFSRLPLHINLRLQGLQPIEDRAVLRPWRSGLPGNRLDLRNSLAFHSEIHFRVTVCCGRTRVSQHVTDGRKIDSGLKQRHGGTVPHAVWVEALLSQRWRGFGGDIQTSGENVTNTEPTQRLTARFIARLNGTAITLCA